MAQVAGILTLKQVENFGKLAYFMSAESVKWRKPVGLRHSVIEVEMTKARGKIGKAKALVWSTGNRQRSRSHLHDRGRLSPSIMIHPSAVIHPRAELGADCRIGPYCVIGETFRWGTVCRLHSHVVLDGHTRLGCNNEIFSLCLHRF